jgi:hypothetical protein
MMGKESKGRISEETFDDFLAGQGLLKDAEEITIKRVLAWQITEAMKAQGHQDRHGGAHAHRPSPARPSARSKQPVCHPQHLAPRGQRSRPQAPRRIGMTFDLTWIV